MLLKKLLNSKSKKFKSININGLSLDSRKVKKGSLFFALKGNKFNGEKFILQAIKKGASAIVCYKTKKQKKYKVPTIYVKKPNTLLSKLCKRFFTDKPKNIIAVTGTNGKSSVADYYHQILTLNKIPVASIGTLGVKKNNKLKKINLTSPDIITLHEELEKIKKANIDNVIIEASSHGLHQGRLNGINFATGIFTNFSQDHLDYHKSMDRYLKAKLILFSKILTKNKVMITDKSLPEFKTLNKIAKRRNYRLFTINEYLENKKLNFSFISSFQKKNLLMAILAAEVSRIKLNKILPKLKKIKSINGRLQLVRTLPNQTKVFIDFAHTPEALQKTINSLKKHYNRNISLVFGCGGNRDIKKRPLMAKVANKLCNKIYVTDDNPRKEKPKNIRKTIIRYLDNEKYIDIGNRAKAIRTAINHSGPFEIILIAGKGHETTQDYGSKIIKISDKNIVNITKVYQSKLSSKLINYYHNSIILNKILNKRKFHLFQTVKINSKETKKGNLFIAIKGKHKDGHDYILEALRNGANYCVVSKRINKVNNKKLIVVKNTNNFLNQLGSYKRQKSSSKIIAITGSAGKTSCKNILGSLLSNFENTYFSPKSHNNHYGVPLSLANLEQKHKYGVFEIGMNKIGEINNLSKMVRPNIAIITNIAEAHIENFKNIKGIAKAKSEIINNIKKGGVLILNRDDNFYNYLNNLAQKINLRTISVGFSKKSDIYPIYIKKIKDQKVLRVKVFDKILSLKINNINMLNVLSSIAVLKELKLDLNKGSKYFEFLKPAEGRGKIYNIKRYKIKFKLIDESYNANPLSVKVAIKNFSNIAKNHSKKYLLLGDMLELGKKSDSYHKNLSKIINKTDIDKVFVYGNKIFNTYKYTNKNKQGNILQYKSDFDEVFSKILDRNDYLMIKGSNATGLNKISSNIIKGKKNVI